MSEPGEGGGASFPGGPGEAGGDSGGGPGGGGGGPGAPGEGGHRRRRRRRGGHRQDGRPPEARAGGQRQGEGAEPSPAGGPPREPQPPREPRPPREPQPPREAQPPRDGQPREAHPGQGPRPDGQQGEHRRGRRRRHGRGGQGAPGGPREGVERPRDQQQQRPQGQPRPQQQGQGRREPGPPRSQQGAPPSGGPGAGRPRPQAQGPEPPKSVLGLDSRGFSELDSGWDLPLDAEVREEAESGEVPAAVEESGGDEAPLRFLASPPDERDPDGEDVFTDLAEGPAPSGQLWNTVGVKFRDAGRVHEFDSGELMLERGDRVVVETERGLSIGLVAVPSGRRMTNEPLRRVIRKADHNDLRQEQRNQRRELDALKFAGERVRERKLPMKLFRVEYIHGGNKATFFFSSEGRVDFRDLVRDLTHRLHTRVELRQVGVRDESKIVGGIGTCGRELCCSTWLPRFEPVSIRMAKDQNMVLNPQKVSGVCGRLKCCLAYEEATYRELRKGMPKPGKRVMTPKGEGKVQEVDILGGRVKVWFEGGPPQTFVAGEVQPILPPGATPRTAAEEPEPPEPEVEAETEPELAAVAAEPDGEPALEPAAPSPGSDDGGTEPA
jgi:cell fate regulator YaaT (PSP1 superfamily)